MKPWGDIARGGRASEKLVTKQKGEGNAKISMLQKYKNEYSPFTNSAIKSPQTEWEKMFRECK